LNHQAVEPSSREPSSQQAIEPSSRQTLEPSSRQTVGPSSHQAAQPSSDTATTMPSTTRQAETTAYENVQSNPFTRVIAEMVVQINPSNPFIQVLVEMAARIKVLTAAITQFAATKENSNPNATRGNGGGDHKSRQPHMNKLWNMGGNCSSHGFHPVRSSHNSKTCRCQKEGHNTEATWNNQLGGNMFWPTTTRVAIEQQDHPTWKGKSAPTNGQGLEIAY
jgi:hypothetical protein